MGGHCRVDHFLSAALLCLRKKPAADVQRLPGFPLDGVRSGESTA
jgi:hypothetical protein